MAKILREPYSLVRLKACLFQETDIDAVLAEELVQFYLPAAIPVGNPINQSQGHLPS
jgi:hypothetical protein